MRRAAFIGALLLTGCEEIDSTGELFTPVAVVHEEEATTTSGAPEEFDFDAEATKKPAEGSTSGSKSSSPGLGFGVLSDESDEPSFQLIGAEAGGSGGITMIGATEPESAPGPVAPLVPVDEPWRPGDPLDGSWGVRLISTTSSAQPPLAQLGLPDGSVASVWPGQLLPDAGIVVLAIGRDSVQVAEIVAVGDHARVEPHLLRAMRPEGVSAIE